MDLKALSSRIRFTKFPTYGEKIRPVRDWFILLGMGLVILVITIGWNMWSFLRLLDGQPFGQVQSPESSYDLSSLEKVEAVFGTRKMEEDRYRNDYRFVDPSL